jgi:hypothetical protein
MSKIEEDRAVAEVAARLRSRFPFVEPSSIDEVITDCHREYDGHPIRDFIPILVERQARDHLTAIPEQRRTSPGTEET